MAYRNLVGETFGKLEVIAESEPYVSKGTTARRWLCRCECGQEVVKWGSNLTTGQSTSCGCSNERFSGKARPVQRRYIDYRHGAEKRGYVFELTLEEFAALTEQPCHYCGSVEDAQRGVDRIDSALGYTVDNCVPCCWYCNCAKGEMTTEQYLAFISRVYTFQNRRAAQVASIKELY